MLSNSTGQMTGTHRKVTMINDGRDGNNNMDKLKGAQSRLNGLKSLAKLFKFRCL